MDTGQCQKNFIIRSCVVSLQADFSNATRRVTLNADSDASITTIRFTPTVPLGVICHDLRFDYEYEKPESAQQSTSHNSLLQEIKSDVLNGNCTVFFRADENAAKEAVIELKVNPQNGKKTSDLLLRFKSFTAPGTSNTGLIWTGYRLHDIKVIRNSIHVV